MQEARKRVEPQPRLKWVNRANRQACAGPTSMNNPVQPDRADQILETARVYASASSSFAEPQLYEPMTFLLAQVRQSLGMDVVFVSQFVDQDRIFEVVSAVGEHAGRFVPGNSDPLLDTYCQRIVEARLPAVIRDTHELPAAFELPITRALQIRAYLSAPVVLENGTVFGTLCCISHSPRQDLRDKDALALAEVAKAVAASIDRNGRIRYSSWTGGRR
jgi:GAF domain-containing protein